MQDPDGYLLQFMQDLGKKAEIQISIICNKT